MPRSSFVLAFLGAAMAGLLSASAVGAGRASIESDALREWLTYLSSDALEGRATYSPGLTRAADYIQSHLATWAVEPAGDAGGYRQSVQVNRVKASSRSWVRVRVGQRMRTFSDGDGVNFDPNAGANQHLTLDRVEFVGYGLDLPSEGHSDFQDFDVHDAAIVWMGADGPATIDAGAFRRVLGSRSRHALEELNAAAAIGPFRRSQGGRRDLTAGTFTSSAAIDRARPPAVTADEEVLRFLLASAPVPYGDLKRRAEARETLPRFRLDDVTITFHVDHDYEIESTSFTDNIVGIVPGRDSDLSETYVAYGAHYDHVGRSSGNHDASPPGRVTAGQETDLVWNGADDDGSGTVALMMLARAFSLGPRPKRSLLFVWHTGEERGLWGSRYFVDHPTVPTERIVAQLNVDMVGRNRDDKASEANTVYLVGSDRISSELHEISREANMSLSPPLTLNYDLNAPSDPEQLYYRSDHYSYASKGIPVIFFTTGLHPDYHANTDDVSKIDFQKLTRITELLYETGLRLGDLDHPPLRDRLGPRAGKDPSR